tara:strand:- start:373 stop:837 length:465 start_codon:yes stop_codon:yes gene_type:complete
MQKKPNLINSLVKIILIPLFLLIFFCCNQLFAEIYEVNNSEIKALVNKGVPLIDIRTEGEWYQTGIINKSRLLTFFDKNGNYNLKEWSSKLEKITKRDEPLIIICRSGRRSRIVVNLLKEKELYSNIYHATNGIISWIDSEKTTVRPNQNSFLK